MTQSKADATEPEIALWEECERLRAAETLLARLAEAASIHLDYASIHLDYGGHEATLRAYITKARELRSGGGDGE